jgi:hypothetical protein
MWVVDTKEGYGLDVIAVWTKPEAQLGVWLGCGEDQRRKNEEVFQRIVRGFMWTDDRAVDNAPVANLKDVGLKPAKRKALEENLVKGWAALVSPKKQYVIVYNTKGKRNDKLAQLLAERIEQIRADLYEKQFPPKTPFDDVSIVRICGDEKEYLFYGGPWGSAGYWSWRDGELVLYDASPGAKLDDDTLAVAYHEAFHQYVYYGSGQMECHSWFNEGHGDYYAGARPGADRFTVKPFDWRVKTIKGSLRKGPSPKKPDGTYDRSKGGYVPLSGFVHFTREDYYEEGHLNYAQGWSLVYFLREIVPTNPAWQAKWGKILDTYYLTLRGSQVKKAPKPAAAQPPPKRKPGTLADPGAVPPDDEESPPPEGGQAGGAAPAAPNAAHEAVYDDAYGDTDEALRAAFKGVDLKELEAAWVKSILQVPG